MRHSSGRIRGRMLQTHVGEIRLGEILRRGSYRPRNLHESRHRGSLLHLNQRRGNQRCYGSHHRRHHRLRACHRRRRPCHLGRHHRRLPRRLRPCHHHRHRRPRRLLQHNLHHHHRPPS